MINILYNMLENKMIQSLNLSCIVFRHIIFSYCTKIVKKVPLEKIYIYINEKYIEIGRYINISWISILNTLEDLKLNSIAFYVKT